MGSPKGIMRDLDLFQGDREGVGTPMPYQVRASIARSLRFVSMCDTTRADQHASRISVAWIQGLTRLVCGVHKWSCFPARR